jgi:hypothetical protein
MINDYSPAVLSLTFTALLHPPILSADSVSCMLPKVLHINSRIFPLFLLLKLRVNSSDVSQEAISINGLRLGRSLPGLGGLGGT